MLFHISSCQNVVIERLLLTQYSGIMGKLTEK